MTDLLSSATPSASATDSYASSATDSEIPVQSVIGGNLAANPGHSWYSRPGVEMERESGESRGHTSC